MIHEQCNGTVLVDVTSSYRMLADVSQDRDCQGLVTNAIHVYNIKETCSLLKFWCCTCDEEVSLDDIRFSCRRCGHSLHLTEGVLPSETGGIYCEECSGNYCDGEECVSLDTVYTEPVVKLT